MTAPVAGWLAFRTRSGTSNACAFPPTQNSDVISPRAIDRVNADREPLIITRDRGKPMAVLMSLEDFASYEETRYLLRSGKNAERLLEAIGELDRGGGTERAVAE